MDHEALSPGARLFGAGAELGAPAPEAAAERPRRQPGRRSPLRRAIGRRASTLQRLLFDTTPGRWLHRRLEGARHLPRIEVRLGPAAAVLDGLRVAFVSDVHAGTFLFRRDLVRIAELVMGEGPDLIVLGGDLIDTYPHEIELWDEALAMLRAPLGVVAVPGNHDYYEPAEIGAWSEYLRRRGVEVLTNRGRRCQRNGSEASSFWLAGVDDLTEGRPDVPRALAGRLSGEPTLLVSHHPDVFPEAVRHRVDLQLSGHTHGGQVRLFGWAPMCHSEHRYVAGLYRRGAARLWVGSGVGVTMLPVRVGARPEIALLHVRGR